MQILIYGATMNEYEDESYYQTYIGLIEYLKLHDYKRIYLANMMSLHKDDIKKMNLFMSFDEILVSSNDQINLTIEKIQKAFNINLKKGNVQI
jgi:hypothetical protein